MRLVLAALLAVIAPSIALPQEQEARRNVSIQVSVVETGQGRVESRTEFELLTQDGEIAEVLSGQRIPFDAPATQPAGEMAVAAYTYQNVGMTIQIETKILDDRRMKISGQIEMSYVERAEGGAAADPPIVGTFRQQIAATLTDGKPATVSRIARPGGGTTSIVVVGRLAD
jgi:hypothetical protein